MRKEVCSNPVVHPLEPVWDSGSRVLVLGTMPSPASRAAGFYYMHRGNRFWQVLAGVFEDDPASRDLPDAPVSVRIAFLLRHHIALWDVLHSCRIDGAKDSSIRDPEPNDLRRILDHAPVRAVFATGRTAEELYRRYARQPGMPDIRRLPSPSGANRAIPMEQLRKKYLEIRNSCGEDRA